MFSDHINIRIKRTKLNILFYLNLGALVVVSIAFGLSLAGHFNWSTILYATAVIVWLINCGLYTLALIQRAESKVANNVISAIDEAIKAEDAKVKKK